MESLIRLKKLFKSSLDTFVGVGVVGVCGAGVGAGGVFGCFFFLCLFGVLMIPIFFRRRASPLARPPACPFIVGVLLGKWDPCGLY